MHARTMIKCGFFTSLFLACAALGGRGLSAPAAEAPPKAPIAWGDLGARATAQYAGEAPGLTVAPAGGVRLRCDFQKMAGEVTREGLWLASTVTNAPASRFRVVAAAVGCADGSRAALAAEGTVSGGTNSARFSRPGLAEEYSVSVDGVRQDFVVETRPAGASGLRLELAVSGARAVAAPDGARLVLGGSGRTLAYNRLHVTDATGRELAARLEVPAADRLVVVVADAGAVYPVRIDPTFSDANWSGLGGYPGVNGTIYASVVDGSGNLYVAGQFTLAGTVLANNIAGWNGTSWTALGAGVNGSVTALAVSGSTLYAGGTFNTAGGATANYIASWNGSSWSTLGGGLTDQVYTLLVSGSILYAGGNFGLEEWNGSAWSNVGGGVNGFVYALATSGSTLYAGGYFLQGGTGANQIVANYIVSWNGTSYATLTSQGMNRVVWALVYTNGILYAGGGFTAANTSAANYVASWNGSAWSTLGTGLNATVYSLFYAGGALYAGGSFTTAGGATANGVAKWNGTSWAALGTGVNGPVDALALNGGTLYAGGAFTNAGAVLATNIAAWNGSSWSALGKGFNGPVSSLALAGSTLYAGGSFTASGGTTADYVAKWNGSSWSALGAGLPDQVNTLLVSGSNLYAGGQYGLEEWDGCGWTTPGGGINGFVESLVMGGNTLYAGGYFLQAGTGANQIVANDIVSWDGTNYATLTAPGMNRTVYALVYTNGILYAGGNFTAAGTSSANGIASWDGNVWTPIGAGVNGQVNALAFSTDGNTLYAGGNFTTAGTAVAPYIALATPPPAGTLDHFAITAITTPPTAGTPFTIATITAQDAYNNTVTSFTGTVTLGGTAGVTGTSGNFTTGVLSGASSHHPREGVDEA